MKSFLLPLFAVVLGVFFGGPKSFCEDSVLSVVKRQSSPSFRPTDPLKLILLKQFRKIIENKIGGYEGVYSAISLMRDLDEQGGWEDDASRSAPLLGKTIQKLREHILSFSKKAVPMTISHQEFVRGLEQNEKENLDYIGTNAIELALAFARPRVRCRTASALAAAGFSYGGSVGAGWLYCESSNGRAGYRLAFQSSFGFGIGFGFGITEGLRDRLASGQWVEVSEYEVEADSFFTGGGAEYFMNDVTRDRVWGRAQGPFCGFLMSSLEGRQWDFPIHPPVTSRRLLLNLVR